MKKLITLLSAKGKSKEQLKEDVLKQLRVKGLLYKEKSEVVLLPNMSKKE